MSSKTIYQSPVCSCTICKMVLSSSNISNHYKSKRCIESKEKNIVPTKFSKLTNCKYCGTSFNNLSTSARANHSRWCSENPRSDSDRKQLAAHANSARANWSQSSRDSMAAKISDLHKSGFYKEAHIKSVATKKEKGTDKHTDASKEACRVAALKTNHQRKCKKSHKFIDKNNREFTFDSTWEDAFAIRLDSLDISWNRPGPILYVATDGRTRRYFPDFYLPDYNLYVDPKNPYVIKQQQEKLDIVSKQINLLILQSKEECEIWRPREESNLIPSTQL